MVEQDENGNYPIEASGRGDNTECVMCDAFNASRHYAVCLRTIGNHENDTRRENDSTCHRAMELSICPAQGMLADERDAGVALYYSPRTPHPAGQTEIDKPTGRNQRILPASLCQDGPHYIGESASTQVYTGIGI